MGEADIIMGIKPIKPENVLQNKLYMMYTRIHTFNESTKPLLLSFIDKKCSLIDYECVRHESTKKMLIGSSRLAGKIGAFNSL